MSDQSQVQHIPGVPYPGVYLCGQDALMWASILKMTPEQYDDARLQGCRPIRDLVALLESCRA
jgi:hypothetical protein